MRNPRFITTLFLAFRLVYIPLSVLAYSGHGGVWLNALLGIALTFGGEWLGRRGRPSVDPRREIGMVAVALLLVGLFPEEAPVGLLLWAGMGLAWGRLHGPLSPKWLGLTAGALLGISALWGPGSWIMAGLLLWQRREWSADHADSADRSG